MHGYQVRLFFLSTDNIQLLHNRINERVLRGEHFVRPDIVEERYHVSLKLLRHYFKVPDVVQLIDNSVSLKPIALKEAESYKLLQTDLPLWFKTNLLNYFIPTETTTEVRDLPNVDEVRKRYQQPDRNRDEE